MTGERIDHAAEARGHLDSVSTYAPDDAAWAGVRAECATAEAVLALVEQQRIANVIRLESMSAKAYDRLLQNTSIKKLREGLGL